MEDDLLTEIYMLQEHINSIEPMRHDLICLNADALYVYRPSRFLIGHTPVLTMLGITCDKEHIDMVDGAILSSILSYIFIYKENQTMVYKYMDEVIGMIANKTRVIQDVEILIHFESIIRDYFKKIREHIDVLVYQYVSGYKSMQYSICYDELKKSNKHYVLVNANVYFTKHSYDITLYLKRYTKIETKRVMS